MNTSDETINLFLDELLKLHPKKIDLSLDRIKNLLQKMDNPQDKIENIIHIAGTNGKFSTLKFIQALLRENQKSTNAYISPHLIRFNERFELDGQIINNDALLELLKKTKEINNNDPITFFEITSACFFEAASKTKSDFTLLETGLGGRLDSSNVIIPKISVITSISHDHHEFLGESIEKIAAEKAGIIKDNVPTIIGFQPYEKAQEILLEHAKKLNSPVLLHGRDWSFEKTNKKLVYEDEKQKIEIDDFNGNQEFQIKNLGLAIAATSLISGIDIITPLSKNIHQAVTFPGRFEKIEVGKLKSYLSKGNELYLDGSHNPDAAKNINISLEDLNERKDLCMIIGMLNTKDPLNYVREFSNIKLIKTIEIPGEENSLTAKELKDKLLSLHDDTSEENSIEDAIRSIASSNPDARILICGSLYLAGQVLKLN